VCVADPTLLAHQQHTRSAHRAQSEATAQAMSDMMDALNDLQREAARTRMDTLSLQALLNTHTIGESWQHRENVRVDIDLRTAQLRAKLEAAAAASDAASGVKTVKSKK
jgi:hypothetical protein